MLILILCPGSYRCHGKALLVVQVLAGKHDGITARLNCCGNVKGRSAFNGHRKNGSARTNGFEAGVEVGINSSVRELNTVTQVDLKGSRNFLSYVLPFLVFSWTKLVNDC